ncbi:MAG: hypothetical protein A2283_19165 [Lentisphaerae bacterium RIFOXYA12_FULL_48_11]|nr:MAG: hypothetical protein A2283_19165 [Lentisphaerae bacterium RIFOXYA12_FULL_48_11]
MTPFEHSVFVNCPLDPEYADLMRPLLFTVLYLGLTPRLAIERTNANEPRISKIAELIESSQYGIHDLSRMVAKEIGEVFRFNMPFELGLDYACCLYHGDKWTRKKCLILEAEKYRFQAALSDLSNSDIKEHDNKPDKVVLQVRNWLVQESLGTGPSATVIWYEFNDFMGALYDELTAGNWSQSDLDNLPVPELLLHMRKWIDKAPNKAPHLSTSPRRARRR